MKNKSIFITIILIFSFAFLFYGDLLGGQKANKRSDSESSQINSYFKRLDELDQPKETSDYTLLNEQDKKIDKYVCHSKTFKGCPGFNTFLFSRSNVDVLYPGSLLSGESVRDRTYALSSIKPAPITLTVNLHSIKGPISRTIQDPSYSTVASAIHDILSQKIKGDAGAEMSWSVDTVYSKAHLKTKLGIDAGIEGIFGVSGNIGMSFSAKTRNAVIQFNQKYYDVVINVPRNPANYIAPSINYDSVVKACNNLSPMYVSYVSYGRYVLFYFESNDLSFDLKKELKASITVPVEGVPVKAGGSSQIDAGFSNGTLSCKAFILGGSAENASAAINSMDELLNFIKTGGRYSKYSPGKPISYHLRYLSNNKPVRIINATEYEMTTCSEAYSKYRIKDLRFELRKNDPLSFNQIDIFGGVEVSPGGAGKPSGGGMLWYKRYIDFYPIHVGQGHAKKSNRTVDVAFSKLIFSERDNAFIDLEFNIDAKWGFSPPEHFYPRTKRLYLNELTEGIDFEEIKTAWHTLKVTYEIKGIK